MSTKLNIWITASRPKTLWAAIAPVMIGTSMAAGDGMIHLPSALAALTAAVLIQLGANFANDYYDFQKGADNEQRIGPLRVTQAGMVTPDAMKRAFILVFLLAFIMGIYLIWRGGVPIFVIGVVSILFGILYTGGPFPLGYLGLGDIAVLLFFGPVAVGGTYYVQALSINGLVIIAGFAPGLISGAILTVNNLRDINTDRQSGKKTMAVRFGELFTRIQYVLSLVFACLVPLILILLTGNHIYSAASAVILFLAIPAVKTVFQKNAGSALNKVLADTGKLLIIFSLIFSVGWIL